eukprot:scaffold29018_cov166-Skeletonema_menzelii.AAC.1
MFVLACRENVRSIIKTWTTQRCNTYEICNTHFLFIANSHSFGHNHNCAYTIYFSKSCSFNCSLSSSSHGCSAMEGGNLVNQSLQY